MKVITELCGEFPVLDDVGILKGLVGRGLER